MEVELAPYVKTLLKDFKFSDEIHIKAALNLDALIFNTVALICTIALIKGKDTIKTETIKDAGRFILDSCESKNKTESKKTGGSTVGMPLDNGGYVYNPLTGVENPDGNTINFDNGVAHNGLTVSNQSFAGGASLKDLDDLPKLSHKFIKAVLEQFELKASKKIIEEITRLIEASILCFKNSLYNHSKDGEISVSVYDRLLKQKRFASFN